MSTQAILGRTLPGRYPRWGYLDRLEVNEAMPRACAATLAMLAAASLLVVVVQQLLLASGCPVVPVRQLPPFGTQPLPPPLPRPHMIGRPRPNPTVTSHPRPRPVGDCVVLPDASTEIQSSPGGGNALGQGEGAWDIPEGYTFEAAEPQPEAEAYFVVEHEPRLVWMREPSYPELARDAGIEGQVLVRVLVGADGTVRRVALLQGVLGLDEAALEAAATAIFAPALQQGRPVSVWVVIPIEFRLSSADR